MSHLTLCEAAHRLSRSPGADQRALHRMNAEMRGCRDGTRRVCATLFVHFALTNAIVASIVEAKVEKRVHRARPAHASIMAHVQQSVPSSPAERHRHVQPRVREPVLTAPGPPPPDGPGTLSSCAPRSSEVREWVLYARSEHARLQSDVDGLQRRVVTEQLPVAVPVTSACYTEKR